MLNQTKAIVLHSFKYGDEQVIVELLTETCGRQSCIVHIPKTQKGKLKKQYFQPLFLLDIILDIRPNAKLQKIRDARVAVPFTSIPYNPYKLSISLFTAEFIRNATLHEQTDEVLFAYIENSILWLDRCDDNFTNFHLVFMMRLAKFLGFYPNLDDYMPGDWFDLRGSCFCRTAPLHHDRLTPDDAEKIGLMLRMNFPTMYLYKMSHDERNRLVDVIIYYYRLHIPDFPELKSLPVLKELFR